MSAGQVQYAGTCEPRVPLPAPGQGGVSLS